MKRVVFALAMVAVAALGVNASQDVAPISKAPNYSDGSFPILFEITVSTTDTQCVGVGYDGTNVWVTAGDGTTGSCSFYIFDEYGNLLDTVPQGGGATGWGHRDLAWDGTYMWGSYSGLVDAFGGDYQYAGYFAGPISPNRAMAYDGSYYYTCGFSEYLYRLTWDGNFGSTAFPEILTSTSWSGAYGLAYDEVSNVLWMTTADYTGTINQIGMDGALINTYTTMPEYDIQGGCTMACTAQFGYVLLVLQQGTPYDMVTFYDLGYGPTATDMGSWGAIKAMFR